jgi:hypothetical protein
MVISGALLAGAEQIGGMVYLLMQLVAVVIFVIRIWPRAFATSWTDGAARHFAIASIWAVAALLLFMYLVFTFISAENPDDPAAFPINVLLASDHAVYIGVITNIVLGLLSLLFVRGRAPGWVSQVIFWGVNLGLLVFAIGLILDTAEIKRIGAPVMGVTLLLALGLLAMRAWGTDPATEGLDATG